MAPLACKCAGLSIQRYHSAQTHHNHHHPCLHSLCVQLALPVPLQIDWAHPLRCVCFILRICQYNRKSWMVKKHSSVTKKLIQKSRKDNSTTTVNSTASTVLESEPQQRERAHNSQLIPSKRGGATFVTAFYERQYVVTDWLTECSKSWLWMVVGSLRYGNVLRKSQNSALNQF